MADWKVLAWVVKKVLEMGVEMVVEKAEYLDCLSGLLSGLLMVAKKAAL